MEQIIIPNKVYTQNEGKNEATIIAEPCYPGYGTTLGNALRRVLLSSLPGTAISSIKIKGVDHEFSTIPYIKEDIIEIILNLKNLRLRLFKDEPVRIKLKSDGKKIIKASDIEKNADVEIANSDLKIAEATDAKAKLEIEMIVENGRGYVPVEQKNAKDLEIGMIAIDSIFTPVLAVGYEIESTRVGQRTDYDRLKMKIKTDGTIKPFEAFSNAAKILIEQFNVLSEPTKFLEKEEKAGVKKEETKESEISESVKNISLPEFNFSTRTFNALDRAKIRTLGEIIQKSERELLTLSGFGQTALKEVRKALKKHNLELKP